MIGVIEEFYEKVDEIEDYFNLIESLTSINDNFETLSKASSQNPLLTTHLLLLSKDNLLKTMNASFFLLLYNLIESTIRQGVIAIYDELKAHDVSFNSLRPGLKHRILHDSRKKVGLDYLKAQIASCIEKEIINASLNSKKLFSGNVDREEIKNYAEEFGFSYKTDYSLTSHGEKLNLIKDHRNDLAHGNISFKELGRNYSLEDLKIHKDETVYYLLTILENIKAYLENHLYLVQISDMSNE